MLQIDAVIGFLDSRSFGTVWFWILLAGMWSASGRSVLGVPVEVLTRARARRSPAGAETLDDIALLDWLSLTLPRWRLGRTEGALFLGGSLFLLTSLGIMGFGYWLEMAQALTLLLTPFAILFWMRVLLARRLIPLLAEAQDGARTIAEVAHHATRRMVLHRRLAAVLSVLSVVVTALWGTLWVLMHPFGL